MLCDEFGQPLDSRIVSALEALLPRFRRHFFTLTDEAVIADLMEDAGRRIARHEAREGPVGKLHGFAWITLRNCAISYLRRADSMVERNTVSPQRSGSLLARQPSQAGSPAEIEHTVFLHQVLQQLSDEERWILVRKQAGFSSKDIARELRIPASRIDQIVFRTRTKLRRLLGWKGEKP